MSFPGSPEFESQAARVATDLNTGNAYDAANVLREQIYRDPRDAGALIQRSNEEAPAGRDRIMVDREGDVAVMDKYTGQETFAGRLPHGFPPIVIDIGGWHWGEHHHRPEPFPHPRPFPHPGHDGRGHGHRW